MERNHLARWLALLNVQFIYFLSYEALSCLILLIFFVLTRKGIKIAKLLKLQKQELRQKSDQWNRKNSTLECSQRSEKAVENSFSFCENDSCHSNLVKNFLNSQSCLFMSHIVCLMSIMFLIISNHSGLIWTASHHSTKR